MSRTPILDGEQPLPVRKLRWAGALLLGAALGGALIAIDRATGSHGPQISPQGLLAAIVAFYIAVFVHECGHLIAGILTNFEPRTFMVGVFLFSKEAGNWRFRLRPRYLFSGGFTGVQPRSDYRLLNRFLILVAGGPVASLLLLAITVFLPGGLWTRVLFWINLLVVISVCIPYTTASLPSDSKQILSLAGRGPVSGRLVATLYLLALDGNGIEPKDWPQHWIASLDVTTKDTSRLPQALAFLLARAVQEDDVERTPEILERALAICDKMLPALRRAFLAGAACYHGFYRSDADRAEQWLKQARAVKGATSQEDWDAKAEAAISFARGDPSQAVEMLDRHIAFLNRQPASGMVAAERRRMSELRDHLATQPSAGPAFSPAAQAGLGFSFRRKRPHGTG